MGAGAARGSDGGGVGHEALGWAGKSSWGGGRVSGCREGAFPAHGPHYPSVKGGEAPEVRVFPGRSRAARASRGRR